MNDEIWDNRLYISSLGMQAASCLFYCFHLASSLEQMGHEVIIIMDSFSDQLKGTIRFNAKPLTKLSSVRKTFDGVEELQVIMGIIISPLFDEDELKDTA